MGQDIRKLFSEEQEERSHGLPKGHLKRFEHKLEREFPQEKQDENYLWWKMAAVFVVVLGTAAFFLLKSEPREIQVVETSPQTEIPQIEAEQKAFALSDISPEYKRVEDYYLASINVEIAKLNITSENKELIDSFMVQLAGLDEEYKKLNLELAEAGINEQSIEALVDNLRLRVELLLKLKQKLKELNQYQNEKYQSKIS